MGGRGDVWEEAVTTHAACYGGSDPYNCPQIQCPGCRTTFIHSPGKAQLCPVCKGSGEVGNGLPGINEDGTVSAQEGTRTCHGCGGKGWVVV